MPRLFISLALPEELKQELSLMSLGLPGGRAVPKDQLHLTLRFLGDLEDDQLEDVDEALCSVRHPPVTLTPKGVGCFPRRKDPRVVWVGIDKNPELSHLYSTVENALRRVGIPPEGRKFHPHVSICRLNETPVGRIVHWLEEHSLFKAPAVDVDSLDLMASELHPSGARHELLSSHPLVGEPSSETSR